MGLSLIEMSSHETHPPPIQANADDDLALVAAARRDPRAFGALYEKYANQVYRFCFARLRNEPAAQDATSQIFIKAMQALPQFRDGMFAAWLFRIAHNVVTDMFRRGREHAPLEDVEHHADAGALPEEQAIAASERAAFYQAMDELPDEQRTVLEFTLAGFKGQEIARMLGKTHASIKMLRWRGMETIKTRVAALGYLESNNGICSEVER